jgi:hypothetical protein
MRTQKKVTVAEVEASARALGDKGFTLSKLGRHDEAIAVFDDVVGRFGTAGELALREQVARALNNKGITLAKLGRHAKEIAIYDDIVGRFGTAGELALRELVAMALVSKGFTLIKLGRRYYDEAIAVCDDVARRFGTASESALHELVAMALVNKGIAVAKRGGDATRPSRITAFSSSQIKLPFFPKQVEFDNQSEHNAEHSPKSISGVAGGTETPASTDMQELERRWALIGLPETPSRMWTPRPSGRPPKGVSYDDELISFIREVYGVHLKDKSLKERHEVRVYIWNKNRELYTAVDHYEKRKGRLPPDIELPARPTLVEERLKRAAQLGFKRLTPPERRSVVGRLDRMERHEGPKA